MGYRAVLMYLVGEINRPGYYLMSGSQSLNSHLSIREGSSPLETRRQTINLQDIAAARAGLSGTAPGEISTLQGITAASALAHPV